jgi:hypothetical protein
MHVPSALLLTRAITGNITATNVSIPYNQPVYAEKLDPRLPALSIEMDLWPDWSGPSVGKPNQYVNSLIKQVTDRTGAPMYLRVGGESLGHLLASRLTC